MQGWLLGFPLVLSDQYQIWVTSRYNDHIRSFMPLSFQSSLSFLFYICKDTYITVLCSPSQPPYLQWIIYLFSRALRSLPGFILFYSMTQLTNESISFCLLIIPPSIKDCVLQGRFMYSLCLFPGCIFEAEREPDTAEGLSPRSWILFTTWLTAWCVYVCVWGAVS